MARVRKSVVEIRSILSRLQKDLADTEALFDELLSSPSLSSPPSAIATVPNPLREAKEQKLMYMTVALICSYWEGASSKIKNVPGVGARTYAHVYNGARHAQYFPWYKKDLQIVGNIRNCIAHHSGRVLPYKRYIKTKYATNARKRAIRSIPKKYYFDPSKQDPEINLKPNDIKEFFRYTNMAIPEMSRDVGRLFP